MLRDGSDRLVRLPSGRYLVYHGVKRRRGDMGTRLSFASPMGGRTETYGGRLTENITQAVARDLLAAAIVRLEAAGWPVVGHVHDEVIVHAANPNSVAEVSAIMNASPTWAQGLPVTSAGYLCNRYRKD